MSHFLCQASVKFNVARRERSRSTGAPQFWVSRPAPTGQTRRRSRWFVTVGPGTLTNVDTRENPLDFAGREKL